MTSTPWRGFASDNYAGIHPEVLAAIAAANAGHQVAYGDDDIHRCTCERSSSRTSAPRPRCSRCSTAPARTSSRCSPCSPRWGAVVCASSAHINVDEGGAPGEGRRTQAADRPHCRRQAHAGAHRPEAWGWGDEHRAQPPCGDHHPVHRARNALHGRRDRAPSPTTPTLSGCTCISTEPASPTLPQHSGWASAPSPQTPGSTWSQLRRHQERGDARRGGRRAQPGGLSRGRRSCASRHAAVQQDAVRARPS